MKNPVIVNGNAKGIRKRYASILKELKEDFDFEFILTSSLDELNSVSRQLSEQKPELIGIWGGDGTLFHTLNAILKYFSEPPIFFYLPGGTFNTVGRNLGYSGSPLRILKHLGGNKFDVPTLRIKTRDKEYTGFIFTSGLPYKSMEQYYCCGEPNLFTGIKVALWPLVSFLFPFLVKNNNYFDAPVMKVEIDGKFLWEGPTLTVTVSTVPNLGLWIAPFSEEGEGFYTLASSVPVKVIMKDFFKVLRGRFSHPLHYNRRSKEVKITLSYGFLIDGEMFPLKDMEEIIIVEGPVLKFAR